MTIGYLGLGKMGKNMVLNMLEHDIAVVAWNRSEAPRSEVAAAGAVSCDTPEAVIATLAEKQPESEPKIVWLMLPAGSVTGDMIERVLPLLSPGDILIDGANSNYLDTIERSKKIEAAGVSFLDIGVSGGPAGARSGACLMIGGNDASVYEQLKPLCAAISAPEAYGYFGPAGSGHYVKMVHNGIEYGMMQAIGEGFSVMKHGPFDLDLTEVARVYNERSVIESRLVGWLKSGYEKHTQELTPISGEIKHSGEGQWTVEEADRLGVPVPVIKDSFEYRLQSHGNPSYAGQVVSVLRNEFGGHDVEK